MPDQPASERTEEPTEERLRKAHQEGQVAQSQEVPSALLLGTLLVVSALMAVPMYEYFVRIIREGIGYAHRPAMTFSTVHGLLTQTSLAALWILVPFFVATAAASIFSSLISSGLHWCPKALKLKLDRISPVKGCKNVFSGKSVVRLLVSLAKLALILLILYSFVKASLGQLEALHWTAPQKSLHVMMMLSASLLLRVVIGLVGVALIDWLYQRYSFRKQLRMTRQEIKEERKQYEQSGEVKGRIRGIQMAMARKRMLNEVATADVVITNPTHFAVALKYDPANMSSPEVVAKGADLVAARIREIAKDNDVPIVEKPPLARALYSTVDVGQGIPESLFVAVAEVLAMIYEMRMNKQSTGR